MHFWIIDVYSDVNIDGCYVSFDYTNRAYSEYEAILEAKRISGNPDVTHVSVHHWMLLASGEEVLVNDCEQYRSMSYRYDSKNNE